LPVPAADTSPAAAVLDLIAEDMAGVDLVISSRLDTGVPLVRQVSKYIISAGGKRLRPALLLLMAGALGYREEQRFNLAAVVEFIHTATLLHDDVVDDSTLRRGRATANQQFGNQLLPLPLEMPAWDVYLYWHANVEDDPANKWLRERLTAAMVG